MYVIHWVVEALTVIAAQVFPIDLKAGIIVRTYGFYFIALPTFEDIKFFGLASGEELP